MLKTISYSTYWQTNHKLLYVVRYCSLICKSIVMNKLMYVWVMEWTVKHSLMSRLSLMYVCMYTINTWQKAAITGNITSLTKVYRMRLKFQGTKLSRFSRSEHHPRIVQSANISSKCCKIVNNGRRTVPVAPLSQLYWIGSTNTVNASLNSVSYEVFQWSTMSIHSQHPRK